MMSRRRSHSSVPVPSPEALTTALAELDSSDRAALLGLWREMIGAPPPKSLSLPFLRRAIAFEMQCAALDAPKSQTLKDLKRIGNGKTSRASTGAVLKPGARLVREWKGRTWTVDVVEGGYLMAGERYVSLSAIAGRITGAHWSGPRFFGLNRSSGNEGGQRSKTARRSGMRSA
ncbi:MAG: hypothetical protein C0606_13370 [Hyphomicrobiales bacterium]|nr:MAG: hypothetical protein C0606_13370 [Hyphomicrobiales bacterium]